MAALARLINGQTILAAVALVMTILTKKAPENWGATLKQIIMTVGTGAVVYQLQKIVGYLKTIVGHTGAINARTNHMEGRSMLTFAAIWHRCSVQIAYKLWQTGYSQVPPTPTSQSFWQEEGCPLVPADQAEADAYLTPEKKS